MVDRAKDMIITGAENVYSVEVEAVLAASRGRRRGRRSSAIPDERWGEAVHAVVVARAGATSTPTS